MQCPCQGHLFLIGIYFCDFLRVSPVHSQAKRRPSRPKWMTRGSWIFGSQIFDLDSARKVRYSILYLHTSAYVCTYLHTVSNATCYRFHQVNGIIMAFIIKEEKRKCIQLRVIKCTKVLNYCHQIITKISRMTFCRSVTRDQCDQMGVWKML
jgi:hypothetical protein